MRREIVAGIAALSAVSGRTAWAQTPSAAQPPTPPTPATPAPADATPDTMSAERPGFTNGTDTVTPGRIQLETGYLFVHQSGTDVHHFDDSGQLRFPLRANTEVRLVLPVYYYTGPMSSDSLAAAGGNAANSSSNGFGDFGISYKWRFLEESAGHHPSLALIAGTSIPSGAHEVWANRPQPMADLEAQFGLGPLFTLQGNLNYTRADDGDEFNQYGGAINLGYNLTPAASPFIEVARQTPTGSDGAPRTTYFDGGITYAIGRNVQVDLNAGTQLASPLRSDHFYGVGFARRW